MTARQQRRLEQKLARKAAKRSATSEIAGASPHLAGGYERATVRTIAEMADIHPSMVMRCHNSKEGLFTASSQFKLQLPNFAEADAAKVGELIVKTFLDRSPAAKRLSRMWSNSQVYRFTNRMWITIKPPLPQFAADQYSGRPTGGALFGHKLRPSEGRTPRMLRKFAETRAAFSTSGVPTTPGKR